MDKILQLTDLYAGYGTRTVVGGVNLTVHRHDFIGFIGPNGGGKTTLLKTILGLVRPFSGKIRFFQDGEPVTRIPMGYLPQVNSVDKRFPITVEEVVLSGLMGEAGLRFPFSRLHKVRVKELLKKLGISALAEKPIGQLSGGQMQRSFLGRAIIARPHVLILDEPSTYVDSNFEKELYQILNELNHEMAILLVSHDVGMVASHVKTIACVNGSVQVHDSNLITSEMMAVYNCPIEIITHGDVPHRVLDHHHHGKPE
jgi:zinc transport system ATP-binding protein